MKNLKGPALVAIMTMAAATAANAATVTISHADAVDTPDYNLTTIYGIGDWAYWASTDNPTVGTSSNEKSGANLISSMSVVGGGGFRGSTSSAKPVYDLVFTDGTSPVSGTASDLIGLTNTQLDTVGAGVQLQVTSPTADPFSIYVWGASFNATGTLSASVGAANDAETLPYRGSNTRAPGSFFTIIVDPDAMGQIVTLQLTTATDEGSFASVSLASVAVDTAAVLEIPAPAALPTGLALLVITVARLRR